MVSIPEIRSSRIAERHRGKLGLASRYETDFTKQKRVDVHSFATKAQLRRWVAALDGRRAYDGINDIRRLHDGRFSALEHPRSRHSMGRGDRTPCACLSARAGA